MARWQVTISDPDTTANKIPDVVLESFGAGGYRRSEVRRKTFGGWSLNGAAQVQGATGSVRYVWNLSCLLQEGDCRRLMAILEKQNIRYDARLDGHLLLTDEVEELPPLPSPYPKTLLAALTTSYGGGLEYGFGKLKVKIDLPENHLLHAGVDGSGNLMKLVTLVASEVG